MKLKTKGSLLSTLVLLIGLLLPQTAYAVENGIDASGNSFVVPIQATYNATQVSFCSGVLIAPEVVATAGHCLLDESGQVAKSIWVGAPGSSPTWNSNWAVVLSSYFSADYQGNTVDKTVGPSDIAFLRIDRPYSQPTKIYLASENQLLTLKNTSATLRLIGYGFITDAGASASAPNYFDAKYNQTASPDPNQSYAESSLANTCKGDSGGPVLSITPNKVIIVGVITGAAISQNCTKAQSNGKYLTAFTIINRFSNLALAAAVDAMEYESQAKAELATKNAALATTSIQGRNDLIEAQNTGTRLQSELDQVQAAYDELSKQLLALQIQVKSYAALGIKSISCVSGAKVKAVVGLKPVCPIGYKLAK